MGDFIIVPKAKNGRFTYSTLGNGSRQCTGKNRYYIFSQQYYQHRQSLLTLLRLLAVLYFDLTNPMVPNLSNDFFIFIGLGLRDSFARNSLGENGYFSNFDIISHF